MDVDQSSSESSGSELQVDIFQKNQSTRGQWQQIQLFDSIRISKKSGKVLRIVISYLPFYTIGNVSLRLYELNNTNCSECPIEIVAQEIKDGEVRIQAKIFTVAKCCQFYAVINSTDTDLCGQSVQFSTFDNGKVKVLTNSDGDPNKNDLDNAAEQPQHVEIPIFETNNTMQYVNDQNDAQIPSTLVINQPMMVQGSIHAYEFIQYSDQRLKDHIEGIHQALSLISKLRGTKYTWKRNGQRAYGLIAQEVRQVIPEVVHENERGLLSVNYIELVPILIAALNQHVSHFDRETHRLDLELTRLSKQLQAFTVEASSTQDQRGKLFTLPHEVIRHVFWTCHWQTLLQCCSVSKTWRGLLVADSALWQRVIESDWCVELVQKQDSVTWYGLATKLAKVPKIGHACQGHLPGYVIALVLATECFVQTDHELASMWCSHFNVHPDVDEGQVLAGVTCWFTEGSNVFWQPNPREPYYKQALLVSLNRATSTAVVSCDHRTHKTAVSRLRVQVHETTRRHFMRLVVSGRVIEPRVIIETECTESGLFFTKTIAVSLRGTLKKTRPKQGCVDIGVRFQDGVEKWTPKSYELFAK